MSRVNRPPLALSRLVGLHSITWSYCCISSYVNLMFVVFVTLLRYERWKLKVTSQTRYVLLLGRSLMTWGCTRFLPLRSVSKSALSLLVLHKSLVNYSFSQTVCESENQMSSLFELNCKLWLVFFLTSVVMIVLKLLSASLEACVKHFYTLPSLICVCLYLPEGPYSFFLRVVCQARMPDGILAC